MTIAYCGTPPAPGELLARFNLDPLLIVALLVLTGLHLAMLRRQGVGREGVVTAGWALAAFALISPLCALSVSLFAARVGQHMLLALVAAPLIALGLPRRGDAPGWQLWASGGAFSAMLWLWHLPAPYAATFRSDLVYWTMHVTLFGSALLLWRDLLQHRAEGTLSVLALGGFTTVQMGLLGGFLTFVHTPLFAEHFVTAGWWGMSPLADQALGGLLMWVPGMIFFLIAAWRSFNALFAAPATAR